MNRWYAFVDPDSVTAQFYDSMTADLESLIGGAVGALLACWLGVRAAQKRGKPI